MFHIKKKIQLICNATPVQLKVYNNICNMNNELIQCPDNEFSKSECSGMAFSGCQWNKPVYTYATQHFNVNGNWSDWLQ